VLRFDHRDGRGDVFRDDVAAVQERAQHRIRLELGEADVEGAVEEERRGDRGGNLPDEAVEIGVDRVLDVNAQRQRSYNTSLSTMNAQSELSIIVCVATIELNGSTAAGETCGVVETMNLNLEFLSLSMESPPRRCRPRGDIISSSSCRFGHRTV
jgi:hypothetical protein